MRIYQFREEENSMKESAMKTKLVVRPIVGQLLHTHFWEGPCRAGRRENMEPEAERADAEKGFQNAVKKLEAVTDEIDFLPAVHACYMEDFVVKEDVWKQIEEDLDKVDFFLCINWRIPKLERYRKPIVIMQNGNEGIDVAAYCNSIGLEAHVAMDIDDLNHIAHLLWVRKAVANTRALVLTAGAQPPFGLQSVIRDGETIRQKYGMEIIKIGYREFVPYMDAVSDEEAKPIAEKLFQGAMEVKVNRDWFMNDIKYYLAVKKMMDVYDCNAFSTSCHELCTSEIPQQKKFTPCVCHSLLKEAGIPSACEEDLNALLAMTVMQYAANRPAFMGNPSFESDEILKLHHAVPALCMNGYGTEPLEYKLWAFTGQGFGGKLQVDFTQNKSDSVTLGRFNPAADTLSVKTGKVVRSEYNEIYCSPFYYIQMDCARKFMHHLAKFGHHQVLIFGDYVQMLEELSEIMGFQVSIG